MPELINLFIFIVLIFAVLWQSIALANLKQDVDDAILRLKTGNARSVTLAKMAYVETSLTELTDAYDALLASHKKLRARIGMRAVREQNQARKDALPDSQTDPAGYKKAMRLKLNQAKL